MFEILTKGFGYADEASKLTCPRCGHWKFVKHQDSIGDIEVYRCFSRGMDLFTGQPRRCGQIIHYMPRPMPLGIDPKDLKKRPELLGGKTMSRRMEPMLGVFSKRLKGAF